jgi:hypothetical protein
LLKVALNTIKSFPLLSVTILLIITVKHVNTNSKPKEDHI